MATNTPAADRSRWVGVPAFTFQDGGDPEGDGSDTAKVFREIARLLRHQADNRPDAIGSPRERAD
jgi:hypothetical protein